jgi:AcrR family transcriptional regulator
MLDAAAHVMRKRGLARATTKEIARVAGYSEAALYKHFRDKDDLYFHVLTERLPRFAGALGEIAGDPGGRTVQEQLVAVAVAAMTFYDESMPISASLLSEPSALDRQRARMRESGRGPEKANEALAAYLRAEQELGRISKRASAEAAANLLLGACFQWAFLTTYHGVKPRPAAIKRAASEIVATLLHGLAGARETPGGG